MLSALLVLTAFVFIPRRLYVLDNSFFVFCFCTLHCYQVFSLKFCYIVRTSLSFFVRQFPKTVAFNCWSAGSVRQLVLVKSIFTKCSLFCYS